MTTDSEETNNTIVIEDGYYDLIDSVNIANQIPLESDCKMFGDYSPISHTPSSRNKLDLPIETCCTFKTPISKTMKSIQRNHILYSKSEFEFTQDGKTFLFRKPRRVGVQSPISKEDDLFDDIFSSDSDSDSDSGTETDTKLIVTENDNNHNDHNDHNHNDEQSSQHWITDSDGPHPLSTSTLLRRNVEENGYVFANALPLSVTGVPAALQNKIIPRILNRKMRFLTDVMEIESLLITSTKSCLSKVTNRPITSNLNLILKTCNKYDSGRDLDIRSLGIRSLGIRSRDIKTELNYRFYQDIRIRSNIDLRVWVFLANQMVEIGRGTEIRIDAMTDLLVHCMYVEIDGEKLELEKIWGMRQNGITPYVSFDYAGIVDMGARFDPMTTKRLQNNVTRDRDLMISNVESDRKRILIYARVGEIKRNETDKNETYDRGVMLRVVKNNEEVDRCLAELSITPSNTNPTNIPSIEFLPKIKDTQTIKDKKSEKFDFDSCCAVYDPHNVENVRNVRGVVNGYDSWSDDSEEDDHGVVMVNEYMMPVFNDRAYQRWDRNNMWVEPVPDPVPVLELDPVHPQRNQENQENQENQIRPFREIIRELCNRNDGTRSFREIVRELSNP